MDIKIYVCHHKDGTIYRNKYFEPIQVGRALSHKVINGIIGDDTGDNISSKNREWCELTGLYWIWKNTNHDYVGINHYRRYIIFERDYFNKISFFDKKIDKISCFSKGIEEICYDHSIVLPPLLDVEDFSSDNVYNHYCEHHYKKDIDVVISIVKNKHKDYYDYVIMAMKSKECVFGNLFVMRRDVLDEYCSFLFSVLFSAESIIDTTEYDSYQKRVYGFLSERLLYAFLLKKKFYDKNVNIIHVGQVVYLDAGFVARVVRMVKPKWRKRKKLGLYRNK
ncbi:MULTISPECIES: DUF4422 domain-containing protein [unclassified Saccharibacter]|uniref:DUF4422 domain-containing protein n=1 Tax=unclassified Saccharibacter TaxID=2648722 RepID=UPI0013228B7F|nr:MULTISPECIES: DUF4422 domain-containing protein [unclassified Saccharibacter]MXV36478.1 DUF4422 domain-containing protein [Saccharibacter sp. EH611]MXV57640.1 DUF4422 domain-containing protein [Saccharibacter sp. EH70]MXV65053.1 DUF4422 domain-containing protein [Saccharibacter sp. EH60]